jgi:predicted DNA-binding protein with PD1-like motif
MVPEFSPNTLPLPAAAVSAILFGMRHETCTPGRTFILRLEDGEILHETIEAFATAQGIRAATVLVLGGADAGSRLVTGPREDRALPPDPQQTVLEHVHEAVGAGTIFPDEDGNPLLHLHLACGRGEDTVTGCARAGVKTWHVLEVVIQELTGSRAVRRLDPLTGFRLLEPG